MIIMSKDSRTEAVSCVEAADWQVGEEKALKIGRRKLAEEPVRRDSEEARSTDKEEE